MLQLMLNWVCINIFMTDTNSSPLQRRMPHLTAPNLHIGAVNYAAVHFSATKQSLMVTMMVAFNLHARIVGKV